MRAARVIRTEGPAGIEMQDIDEPVPDAHQVLIDVKAASANFPDVLMSRNLYQYKPEPPFTLGGEIAGVVRKAPEGSTLRVGTRVAAMCVTGGFAECAVAPVERVFALPDSVDFETAACLPMNYLTMLFALRDRGQVRAGETVLVHGAAGGIGTSTIQLARAMGATVISVVSTEAKADFVRALGSHEVVLADTFKDDVDALTGGLGVDVVVDPVGGDRFTDSLRSLAVGGRLLVLGFAAGGIPEVKVNRLLLRNIDVRGVAWNLWSSSHKGAMQAMWSDLIPLLESGSIEPPIHARFPMDDAAEALRVIDGRGVFGKAVLVMSNVA